MAKELSQDTGSAADGGDLGFMQARVMGDAAFDDALFGLGKWVMSAKLLRQNMATI